MLGLVRFLSWVLMVYACFRYLIKALRSFGECAKQGVSLSEADVWRY